VGKGWEIKGKGEEEKGRWKRKDGGRKGKGKRRGVLSQQFSKLTITAGVVSCLSVGWEVYQLAHCEPVQTKVDFNKLSSSACGGGSCYGEDSGRADQCLIAPKALMYADMLSLACQLERTPLR